MTTNEVLAQVLQAIKTQQTTQRPQYEGERILVNTFIENWLESKRDIDIRPKTYENYEGRYRNHIKPYFENMVLTNVTFDTVSNFVRHLKEKGVKAGLIHDVIRLLSIAMNEAVHIREYIPKNPCKGVHLPKLRQKSNRPSITDEEVRSLWEVSQGHHYCIAIPILAQTGIRKSELLALTWDALFYDDMADTWKLRITKTLSCTKGKPCVQQWTKTDEGFRALAIPTELALLMLHYKEHIQHNRRTYIIAQKKYDRMEWQRNFHRTLKTWIHKAGIREELSTHAFRHAMATRLCLEKVPLEAIKKQGGWKDDKMVQYYANEVQTAILQNECAKVMGKHWQGAFTL